MRTSVREARDCGRGAQPGVPGAAPTCPQPRWAPPTAPHEAGAARARKSPPSRPVEFKKKIKKRSRTVRAVPKIRKLQLSGLSLTFKNVILNPKKCLKSHKREPILKLRKQVRTPRQGLQRGRPRPQDTLAMGLYFLKRVHWPVA